MWASLLWPNEGVLEGGKPRAYQEVGPAGGAKMIADAEN